MSAYIIRPAKAHDFSTIVDLNLAAIKATGTMELKQLQQLHTWAVYHKVVTVEDQVIAFLLVMPDNQPYQSPNYQWFNNNYTSFWYVDRIVVNEQCTGKKIGGLLYQDLFDEAKKHGIDFISCEYNIKPMNLASKKFHQSHGFSEVATQWLDDNTKQVSLQVASIGEVKR